MRLHSVRGIVAVVPEGLDCFHSMGPKIAYVVSNGSPKLGQDDIEIGRGLCGSGLLAQIADAIF
jgi:hypothetical protein